MTCAVRIFAAAVGLAVVCGAAAQSPAVSPKEADEAKQQQERQITQPLNNQPVWSEIRSGQPQYTSVPARDQHPHPAAGSDLARCRVPVSTGGGFLVAFALLMLAAFYLWRGPIVVHGPPAGRLIERFSVVERAVHWTVAIAFATLALTGLIISLGKAVLLPLIGYTLFSWLAILAKNLHNFVGPILVIALPIMIAVFVGENLFRAHDWNWLKKGGGMITGEHVPSGKANAGQKILFWLMVVALGLTLCVTGLILDFPNFNQTRQTMQASNVLHMIAGLLATCLLLGHAYLGTIGMKGAWDAMRTGYVDETWAKEHHEYWYNDVKSGKADAAVPTARPAHRPA